MKEFSIPQGTRDYVNDECIQRKELRNAFEAVFEKWGYEEVITPMLEYYTTFSIADMKEEEMYKVLDPTGRILTLRPDMTIPLARVAATKFKDSKDPIRFMHCSSVFKLNAQHHGNANEQTDCGVEFINIDQAYADLEILACACESLSVLKGVRYTLEIGNVNFFKIACKDIQLTSKQENTLADLINRKSLKSLEEYCATLNIPQNMKNFFLTLPWLCGDASVLEEARQYAFNDDLQNILNQLQKLSQDLKELGYEETITFDLGKVSSLHYYTGLLFEAFVEGVGNSVLSGGRYDELLKRFGKDMPAVGFAIRLDTLLTCMKTSDRKPSYAIYYPKDAQLTALQEAHKLRSTKQAIVRLYPDDTITTIEIREDVTSC